MDQAAAEFPKQRPLRRQEVDAVPQEGAGAQEVRAALTAKLKAALNPTALAALPDPEPAAIEAQSARVITTDEDAQAAAPLAAGEESAPLFMCGATEGI